MARKVSRFFKPSLAGTVVLFLLASLFAGLGMWQTRRAAEKAATEQQYQAATSVSFESALAGKHRFARVAVSGHYDPVRHILLDNQVWKGRAGVHVFTPFTTLDGTAILVNRGWLPLAADRQTMPAIATPQHETVLRGMLNTLPVPGRMLGRADKLEHDQWPQLVTYLNLDNIAVALDVPLESWVIQLSESEVSGFEGRDWKPVFLSSSRHKGYAFQWFALATVSIIMWVFTGFRKPSGNNK